MAQGGKDLTDFQLRRSIALPDAGHSSRGRRIEPQHPEHFTYDTQTFPMSRLDAPDRGLSGLNQVPETGPSLPIDGEDRSPRVYGHGD
jgi:hypothetical protein